jgi:hypothetical protein
VAWVLKVRQKYAPGLPDLSGLEIIPPALVGVENFALPALSFDLPTVA